MRRLKLSHGRDINYVAAFAVALAGDYSRARAIANHLAKRFPEDTSVQSNYLPRATRTPGAENRSLAVAVEPLKAAIPYELALPSIEFNTSFGGFYPVWVRGEAYLALTTLIVSCPFSETGVAEPNTSTRIIPSVLSF